MKRSLTMLVLLLPFLFGAMFTGRAMDDGQTDSKKGWLGVTTTDMTPRLARSMHVKTNEGALVRNVMEDSPAERAGIKEDDIIVDFNGAKIVDGDDLYGDGVNVAARLQYGCTWINTHFMLVSEMPHGGVKRSGYGRELSSMGIQEFVNKKLVRVASIDAPA